MKLNWICKRSVLFLCSILSFWSLTAQIRLAAIGGVHASNLLESNSIPGYDTSSGRYYSSKTGFTLGVLAEIPLKNDRFFLQPGVVYSSKGNQYEKFFDSSQIQTDTLYDQHTLNLNYVEIPIYLTYKLPLSKKNKESSFYISAGPYIAFIYNVSSSYQNRILPYGGSDYVYNSGTKDLPVGNSAGAYKTTDFGFGLRAGFELGSVMIGGYYSRGLSNAYHAAYSSSFHNEVFGASLGIWLNKIKKPQPAVIDSDHDGIPDTEDSCINIPGTPKWHGCPVPDSDLDGINDEQDSCKLVAGVPKYHGCPIPDSDGDGVNDEEDSCKYVFGSKTNNGCPIPEPVQITAPVSKTILEKARVNAENITFKTNSTVITEKSAPAIQELADTLIANPDLDLKIEGHTDNIGTPEYNMKLSLARANSVKKALVQRGVPENRIFVEGLGETDPASSNDNEVGKAINRRVVFKFQPKKR